jgi:dTDP-4-dehydrorhamnose reductase
MWLVVGGESEIGAALHGHFRACQEPALATTRRRALAGVERPYLDMASPLDQWVPPPGVRSACIAAAVARLCACAADPAGSALINVDATLHLIDRLLARGIYVVYLSTNQVFDGSTPHVPPDTPANPISEYGKQKARTESELKVLMKQGAPLAILRLAKVISPQMPLLTRWVETLVTGRPIRAFHDMVIAPAPISTVTQAIAALMRGESRGVYQLTGPRDVSYADVGRYIAQRLRVNCGLVEAVSAQSAGMPIGATPRHTTLDGATLRAAHGIVVPDIWQVLRPVLSRTAT